jgi:hypothetical protein
MDLVRCQVCGEPLYSTAYLQKLATELDSTREALCPQHRQRQAAWKLADSSKLKADSYY